MYAFGLEETLNYRAAEMNAIEGFILLFIIILFFIFFSSFCPNFFFPKLFKLIELIVGQPMHVLMFLKWKEELKKELTF